MRISAKIEEEGESAAFLSFFFLEKKNCRSSLLRSQARESGCITGYGASFQQQHKFCTSSLIISESILRCRPGRRSLEKINILEK